MNVITDNMNTIKRLKFLQFLPLGLIYLTRNIWPIYCFKVKSFLYCHRHYNYNSVSMQYLPLSRDNISCFKMKKSYTTFFFLYFHPPAPSQHLVTKLNRTIATFDTELKGFTSWANLS